MWESPEKQKESMMEMLNKISGYELFVEIFEASVKMYIPKATKTVKYQE